MMPTEDPFDEFNGSFTQNPQSNQFCGSVLTPSQHICVAASPAA